MCLHAVSTSKKPKPEGEGWKVFAIRIDFNGHPHLVGVYHTNAPISPSDWNKTDVSKKIGGGLYNAGFHIFNTEEGAGRMVLGYYGFRVMLKVRYRGAHTEGTQWPESKVPDSVVVEEFQIIEGQKLCWQETQLV